jgi:uncharacterized membrane protein
MLLWACLHLRLCCTRLLCLTPSNPIFQPHVSIFLYFWLLWGDGALEHHFSKASPDRQHWTLKHGWMHVTLIVSTRISMVEALLARGLEIFTLGFSCFMKPHAIIHFRIFLISILNVPRSHTPIKNCTVWFKPRWSPNALCAQQWLCLYNVPYA